jgi:hypothetical protein
MAVNNSTFRDYNFKDLTGQQFGKWTVLGRDKSRPSRRVLWICLCECGTKSSVRADQLNTGRSRSCKACGRERTHGMTNTTEYNSWDAMKKRCNNPNADNFHNYGGNGITVCDRWKSFENFYADMGPKPSDSHSIERKNVLLGYFPENCKWATPEEQARNKRTTVLLTFQGETMCMKDWATKFGVGASCLRKRLLKGWSLERALTQPTRNCKRESP